MAFDVYVAARDLGRDLGDAGRPEAARAVEDAIAGGVTGTEILLRLRWVLAQLRTELGDDGALAARAAELETRVGEMLG